MPTNLPKESPHEKWINDVREAMWAENIHVDLDLHALAIKANVSYRTLWKFMHFETKNPRSTTLVGITHGLGFRLGLIPKDASLQKDEIPLDKKRRRRKK